MSESTPEISPPSGSGESANLMARRMSPDSSPLRCQLEEVALMGGGALLITSSVIHLLLWSDSYREVEPIGQILVLLGIVGILLALAVVRFATLGLILAGALYLALTTAMLLLVSRFGLLGYRDGLPPPYTARSIGVPIVGLALLAAVAWVISPPRPKPKLVPTPESEVVSENLETKGAEEKAPQPATLGPGANVDSVERIRGPEERPDPVQVATEPVTEPAASVPLQEPAPEEEATPQAALVDEVAVQPALVDEVTPEPVVVDEAAPKPAVVDEVTPQPALEEKAAPEPVVVDEAAPEPVVVVDEAAPKPAVEQEVARQPAVVDEPALVDEVTHEPEVAEPEVTKTSPEPPVVDEVTPQPALVEEVAPEPAVAEQPASEPATAKAELEAEPAGEPVELMQPPQEPTVEQAAEPEPVPESIPEPLRSMLVREQEILERLKRALGPDDPGVLTTRSNIAAYYHVGGDVGRAAALQESIAADSARILGATHPHTRTAQSKAAEWRKLAKKRRKPKVPVSR